MLSVLSSCLLALAAAQGVDPAAKAPATSQTQSEKLLDELIAKTGQLKSFATLYEMTVVKIGESSPETKEIRIDYQAPDKMRLEMGSGSDRMSQLWMDGAFAMSVEGEKAAHGHIDLRAIEAEIAPLNRIFENAFPNAKPFGTGTKPVVYMSWSFDEAAQRVNFAFDLRMLNDRPTPVGWLTILKDKGEKLSESGDHLLLDNDGHFKVSIGKLSGFVETLEGTSPRGDIHLQLRSLACDAPNDAERFDPSKVPSGGIDISGQLRREFIATTVKNLRDAIYSGIAGTSGDAWKDSERTKIRGVVHAYHEYAMKDAFDFLRSATKEIGERAATALKKRLDDGHSEDEVAADRDGMIANLNVSLDKQSNDYSSALAVPEHSPPFPRGDDLLKIEREVATKVFDELVRAPMVRDFKQATSLEKK